MTKHLFFFISTISITLNAQNPSLLKDFNYPPYGVTSSYISVIDNKLILRYNDAFISSLTIPLSNFQVLNSSLYTFKENALLNGAILFNGWESPSSASRELWRSDGTIAGTYMVKDINTNTNANSDSKYFKCIANTCYFSAQGLNGRELWKTDGTNAGTIEVKNINTGTSSSNPFGLEELNGILYFFADNGTNGFELWRSDGTENGTYLVKDIEIGGDTSRDISWRGNKNVFTKIGSFLYFFAYSSPYGVELWKTDGTNQGTTIVHDIVLGYNSSIRLSDEPIQIEHNGILFFSATNDNAGVELWRSDGTSAGTYMVKDINPNNSDPNTNNRDSFPTYFTKLDDKVFFVAFHPSYGREIWYTDGTTVGTQLLKNISTSTSNERFLGTPPDSNCKGFYVKNDKLFFTMDDGINGKELWVSDGTTTGTSMLVELKSGSGSTFETYFNYSDLVSIGNKLIFFGDNGIIGNALWGYDLCNYTLSFISPDNNISNSTIIQKASNSINASNIISNSNVSYHAGKKVELNNGFVVQNGSVFKAEINGCN